MKITDNLLHNQNYTFSEKLCEKRTNTIFYVDSKTRPPKFQNLIVGLLIFVFTPQIALEKTEGQSFIFTILLWLVFVAVILIVVYYSDKSTRRIEEKKNFKILHKKLKQQLINHEGYMIHLKHNGWMSFAEMNKIYARISIK